MAFNLLLENGKKFWSSFFIKQESGKFLTRERLLFNEIFKDNQVTRTAGSLADHHANTVSVILIKMKIFRPLYTCYLWLSVALEWNRHLVNLEPFLTLLLFYSTFYLTFIQLSTNSSALKVQL